MSANLFYSKKLSVVLVAACVVTEVALAVDSPRVPQETPAASQGQLPNEERSPNPAPTHSPETRPPREIPPPPPGVTDLKFGEFFDPIGSRGLHYSARLKSLDGTQVRLLGYMVKQEITRRGIFLLSPVPVKLEEDEMGLADDLPACVVHVIASTNSAAEFHFTPSPLLLTGTLSLGTREEADGRLSSVRLLLSAPVSTANTISTTTAPTTKSAP